MSRPAKKGDVAEGAATSDSRELLLTAAGDLMRERGSVDITLNEVARKAGVNSAMVKYYFGNKAGMLVALLRGIMQPGMVQLQHLVDLNISPANKLRVHISGIANTYFQHPYVNALMHHLIVESPETFEETFSREFSYPVAQAQRSIIEEGVAAGVFRPIEPSLLYILITGACDQLFLRKHMLHELLNEEEMSEDIRRRFVDELCGIILHGICRD